MTEMKKIYLLSEYKIKDKNKQTKTKLNSVEKFKEQRQYYNAFHELEDLILMDGTNKKYNNIFLNMILDYYDEIINQIQAIKPGNELNEEEEEEKNLGKAKADAKDYDFSYFRDCFEKYEVSLDHDKLILINNKKRVFNEKVIEKYPDLKEDYLKLIKVIDNPENKMSADDVYENINNLNERILDNNNYYRLFYIYKYVDVNLIKKNELFKYLQSDVSYLNQFSFGLLNKLGIPIGYSNNSNLENRYLCLLIKNKIREMIEIYEDNKLENINKLKDNNNIKVDNNKEKDDNKMEKNNKIEDNNNKNKKEHKKEDNNKIDNNNKIIDNSKSLKDSNKLQKNNKNIKKNDKIHDNYNKKKEREELIKFVFETFKDIFSSIKKDNLKLFKYFAFIFVNIIFEPENDISKIYKNNYTLLYSYFQRLCEQFSDKRQVNESLTFHYENTEKKKIEYGDDHSIIYFNGEKIILKDKDYSINSFLINLSNSKINNKILLLNNSKKFFCEDKIFGEYYDDFINLLKKICKSNVAQLMQATHEEFKEFTSFYSNAGIMDDLFKNRLKFFPYECNKINGITDKYLMEIYMSSIYMNNIKGYDKKLDDFFKEILYIFNMGFDSVIFQHESLNHYVRGYLFYSTDNKRKISINTKSDHIYYPKQKLVKTIKNEKYLNKFKKILNQNELNELEEKPKLDIDKYLKDNTENEIKITNQNIKNDEKKDDQSIEFDDEGYYYERQLFTSSDEKKLKKFNFFQALMLIDEDAYNLNPADFHYCFIKLKNTKNFSLIKENFRSPLLKRLLENIDINFNDEIKKMTFVSKRGSEDEELHFYAERSGYDVMSYYANNPK